MENKKERVDFNNSGQISVCSHFYFYLLNLFSRDRGETEKCFSFHFSFSNLFSMHSSVSNSNFPTNKKRIQCKECEGFGHIQSSVQTHRKKKNKALNRYGVTKSLMAVRKKTI